MSVFRERKAGFIPPVSQPVFINDLEHVEESTENGILVKEVVHPLLDKDYLLKHPPIAEDFTLLEQLQAGVSVKEVSNSSLLDSPDNLDYDENETAEQELLKALEITENN